MPRPSTNRLRQSLDQIARSLLMCLAVCALLVVGACKGEPRTMQVEIAVEGMVCDSCAEAITHELERLEGVRAADVSYDRGSAVVTYEEGAVEVAALEEAIEGIGYQAEPGAAEPAPEPET
ncbi:cation transporter [Pseudenhygromyxa sp. WMMC2535]|uniref:heavy-metal-associated domain-containing protein n=1 Tax=Pseudenhygromyxa sp. WMMC2535 TaxID=2712867 RepID=UPI001554CD5D|nr:cation transporter [Pseudenhygromyxa sp. WMMC2535]NVB38970.1 cation transporter [Pseudenhygromyxa sp. WMMC2535]